MAAVVRTGIPIRVLVVRGIDPDAVGAMNIGLRGGLGFALQSASGSNPHDVVAALRALVKRREGDPAHRPTQGEIDAAHARWPFVEEATRITKRCKGYVRQSVSVPACVLMAEEDADAAREFFEQVDRYRKGGSAASAIASFFEAVANRHEVRGEREQFAQIDALLGAWAEWRDPSEPGARTQVAAPGPWRPLRHGMPVPDEDGAGRRRRRSIGQAH